MRGLNRNSAMGIVLPGVLAILMSPCAGPANAAEVNIVQIQEHRGKEAEKSREFVQRLGLTRTQARKLIPILEEAAARHLKAYDDEAELLPKMI